MKMKLFLFNGTEWVHDRYVDVDDLGGDLTPHLIRLHAPHGGCDGKELNVACMCTLCLDVYAFRRKRKGWLKGILSTHERSVS